MKNIIKIEFIKIKNYTIFWVIAGVSLGMFLIISLIAGFFKIEFITQQSFEDMDLVNYFRFPHIWSTFTWIASWFNLLLSTLIIIIIGNEFRYQTFRQHVIEGLTRNELLFGKYFVSLVISFIFSIAVFLIVMFFGLINTENITAQMFFEKSYLLPMYFFQAFAYLSFATMIVVLFRNTMLSWFVFICYFIFEWFIRIILMIFKLKTINEFFPMKIITNLTPRPKLAVSFSDNMSSQIQNVETSNISPVITISLLIIYIAIFIGVSFWIMNKRDLK